MNPMNPYQYQRPPGQPIEMMNPYQQQRPPRPIEPQRYLAPHPNMYPIPPPNPTYAPLLPFELPAGARFINSPDDLKYKCSICSRYRSPNYHYRHPIPPGELPKPTVCRKCRKEATDSEESDEDEERVPRARSRSVRRRARSQSRGVIPRRYSSAESRVLNDRRPPGELVRYLQPRETVYVERRSGSSYEDDLYIVSDEEYEAPRYGKQTTTGVLPSIQKAN